MKEMRTEESFLTKLRSEIPEGYVVIGAVKSGGIFAAPSECIGLTEVARPQDVVAEFSHLGSYAELTYENGDSLKVKAPHLVRIYIRREA